jgi:hypothetical protein
MAVDESQLRPDLAPADSVDQADKTGDPSTPADLLPLGHAGRRKRRALLVSVLIVVAGALLSIGYPKRYHDDRTVSHQSPAIAQQVSAYSPPHVGAP